MVPPGMGSRRARNVVRNPLQKCHQGRHAAPLMRVTGPRHGPLAIAASSVRPMERPIRFEHFRYLGDKRNQVVHDVDLCDHPDVIDDLMTSEKFLCFGPDTLAEARNRGYHLCRRCAKAQPASA